VSLVLVREDGLVIGQPAHAWMSGQLARAWGNAAFPAPVPRAPVCLAAEQHDVGWADADLAPTIGPGGRPRSFLEQPRAAHLAIWRSAPRRLLAQSRYAALLVSLHGTSLYERVDADAAPPETAAAIRAYIADQRALQAELASGLDPAEIDRNRRLIVALDRFSLALCHGNATQLTDVPAADGAATIRVEPAANPPGAPAAPDHVEPAGDAPSAPAAPDHVEPAGDAPGAPMRDDQAVPPGTATARFVVDPWPFAAGAVAVGCEARRLDGSFSDEAELRAALAAAPWPALRWELSRG
jgi:hypothetical protein